MDVPLTTQILSIVAGSLAGVVPIDVSRVTNFVSRFGAVFKEYAIVGCSLELRPNNIAVTSGMTGAYIDEQSNSAPTANGLNDVPRLDMINAPLLQVKPYRLDWRPADLLDLDFVSTSATFTPAWLKLYTDTANFGTSASTSGQWIITGALALEFRGYV